VGQTTRVGSPRCFCLQQGQHGGRLAQAHVVGQAGAQPEALQHLEPGHPALLIGAELADEAIGRRPHVEGAFQLAPQQRAQLPFGRDAQDGDPGLVGPHAGRHLEHLADGHGAGGLVLGLGHQEAHEPVHLGRPELHPLAAHVDQRGLQLGQPQQLGLVDLLLPECGLPVEGADALLVEEAAGAGAARRGGRGGGLEPDPETGGGSAPPGRQEHAEAGHLQGRGGPGQEAVGPVEVEGQAGRGRLPEGFAQLGVDAHGPAQLGQEDLVRGGQRTARPLQLVAGPPDLFGVDEQAEVVGGLQEELELPGRFVRWPAGGFEVEIVSGGHRFAQPEAQPPGPAAGGRVGPPFGHQSFQRGQFVVVGVHDGSRGGQGAQPGLERRGQLVGGPARQTDGTGARGGQGVPAHRIDEGAQRVADDGFGRQPRRGEGTADRRQRVDHGPQAGVVGSVHQRLPDGLVAVRAPAQVGQDPSGRHDLQRQGAQDGKGGHRGAGVELVRTGGSQGHGDVERSRRTEGNRRHLEGPEAGGLPGAAGFAGGPDELGGRDRRVRLAGQPDDDGLLLAGGHGGMEGGRRLQDGIDQIGPRGGEGMGTGRRWHRIAAPFGGSRRVQGAVFAPQQEAATVVVGPEEMDCEHYMEVTVAPMRPDPRRSPDGMN
jgi:hypothetical protein